MGAIAETFTAFAQPVLDQTDGSMKQLNKALPIGQLCYNLALLPDDQRPEMLDHMRSAFDLDDEEFDDFKRSLVAPLICRHEQMIPGLHRRDLPGDTRSFPTRVAPRVAAKPSETQRPIDRYAPCPCNSGKKYKFCCGMKLR